MSVHALREKKRAPALRMLVANDPCSYREAVGRTIQALRPDVQVITVPPEMLDLQIAEWMPQLVLSSRVTPAMLHNVLAWVVLYPEGQTQTEICVDGQRTVQGDIELNGLLSVVDTAQQLVRVRKDA